MTTPIITAVLPGPMIQMMVVTINGVEYALIGPVVHGPGGIGTQNLDISDIHFGEIMPAHIAAEMLRGAFIKDLGSEIQ